MHNLRRFRPEVVPRPKAAIKNRRQPIVPRPALRVIRAVCNRFQGFVVASRDGAHIIRTAGPPFDFKDRHPGGRHFVQKVDRLEILGTQHIAVFKCQFRAALPIDEVVRAAAVLQAFAAVSTLAAGVQTHPAASAHSHTERPVAKHFQTHRFTAGT